MPGSTSARQQQHRRPNQYRRSAAWLCGKHVDREGPPGVDSPTGVQYGDNLHPGAGLREKGPLRADTAGHGPRAWGARLGGRGGRRVTAAVGVGVIALAIVVLLLYLAWTRLHRLGAPSASRRDPYFGNPPDPRHLPRSVAEAFGGAFVSGSAGSPGVSAPQAPSSGGEHRVEPPTASPACGPMAGPELVHSCGLVGVNLHFASNVTRAADDGDRAG